jgi:hypothetical protein
MSVPIVKQITDPSLEKVLTVQTSLTADSITYALPLPTAFSEVLLYSTLSGISEYSASSTTDLTLLLSASSLATFTLDPLNLLSYRLKLRIDGVNFSNIVDATKITIEGVSALNILAAALDYIEV